MTLVLLLAGCPLAPRPDDGSSGTDGDGQGSAAEAGGDTAGTTLDPTELQSVRYWGYQIQQLDTPGAIDALAASSYDMLVIEPTRTDWSSDARNFDTANAVRRLKLSKASDGVHRKLVIAYINIGEAEDWRWYWEWSTDYEPGQPLPADWPSYILTVDPDGWTGNYPVAYWQAAWRDLVLAGNNHAATAPRDYVSIVDEVVRDGFDGVYLDWVEAFENEAVIAQAAVDGVDPAAEMIRLIADIRSYCRQRNPGFLVIQQNASALLAGRPQLLDAIDAIAQEEVWFDGVATDDWNDPDGYDQPLDADDSSEIIANLTNYRNAGVPVFNCEYALDMADEAYRRSYERGYIPYCTRRSLGKLTTTRPPDLRR